MSRLKNLKGHRSTFHWMCWKKQILANIFIICGVHISWQILTIKKKVGITTNFLGISEWSISVRSHECGKVMSHSFGLPKHLLKPGDMMEHYVRCRWPVVLQRTYLLRFYTISSPCPESPVPLSNGIHYLDKAFCLLAPAFQMRNFGWWEGLSQQGTLMGHWGQLVRKWEWNSHRTQMQNNTPEGRLYTMFILQWPFCCSVISPSLLSKLVTQKKESWCVKEEKIFLSLKLWNILAEQYLNVNTNVFWCTEKSIIIRNHSCYCIS